MGTHSAHRQADVTPRRPAASLATGDQDEQARPEELSQQAAASWRQAARRLVHDDKLSVRDAAAVLGVSFGRVHQLVRDRAR